MISGAQQICIGVTILAPIEAVWSAWTTENGVKTFFASQCKLDFRLSGVYEMYFDLEAPVGSRGGEGCVLLAIEQFKMLSFSWNAPPEFPIIRQQRTHVTVRFMQIGAEATKVTLTHDGWGTSPDWQQVYHYFEHAWGEVVLPRLVQRFTLGQIDWKN